MTQKCNGFSNVITFQVAFIIENNEELYNSKKQLFRENRNFSNEKLAKVLESWIRKEQSKYFENFVSLDGVDWDDLVEHFRMG